MKTKRQWKGLVLLLGVILFTLAGSKLVYAKAKYSSFIWTAYTDVECYVGEESVGIPFWLYTGALDEAAKEEVLADLEWKTSDASVACICEDKGRVNGEAIKGEPKKTLKGKSYAYIYGVSEGTATITIKSKLTGITHKMKVTVKGTGLAADNKVFYAGKSYTFSIRGGDMNGVAYSSSDESVATIGETTGIMEAKKAGKTTISCLADDGNTYKYKVTVKKKGLSYTKLTSYYFTGMKEGCYTQFPLVAAGIDVKSWKSSNKKVCKVINNGTVGILEMRGTGSCKITCTAKDGKKYTCKLTVVGGKVWSGLNSGYRPTLSELKKHGYYNEINKMMDYGNVIVTIQETQHEISLKNGNTPLVHEDGENAELILKARFPDKKIEGKWSDYLGFNNDSRSKYGCLRLHYYYVSE